MTTTTIILILSVAVAVLTVVVAVMMWLFVRKNRELKKKNEVIIREIYHSQNIIERAVKHGVSRAALLTALLAWLLPQTAGATHVDDTWKYQVSLNGSNTIRIQVPVYDQEGADCWVSNGNLKVTWDGVTKTCFHWQRNGDTDSDSKDIYVHFSTEVGGSFDITQGNSGSHFTMTQGGDYERQIYRNNDGNTYTVYAVWRVPYDMLGKKLTFSWDVERDGNSRSREKVSGLNDVVEIDMPAAATVVHPQVTMSTMSYSEAGKLELPWFMASDKITSLRYQYTDAYGIEVREDLSTKDNNGKIYLDATVPHDNFTIVVSYKDADNYDISNVSSTTQNLAMIHAPVGLTATQLDDGKAKVKVQLDWHVRFPSTDDLAASDFFEVQRSLTGQEADFVTLGTVPVVIDAKDPHFTYTDSTIVSALVAEHLTGGSSLTNLTYRVRRMITQSWGWNHNCAQRVETSVSGLHLLRLKNYTATLTDERSYSVRVNWEYGNEPNAVWDSRAKLMMEVTMRNNAGELVDTKTYELSEDERNARQKVIDLSRTCVKYDIRMYVDPGTSPLRSWDLPDAMRIASAADWNTFRSKVQEAKGQYDVNAILCTDISTTNSCGDYNYPYRGIFDGNGHTLTVNISTSNQYEAPFKYVKDAAIRNLRTAGTITSSQKFIGGIVSQANGNVVIENCRSSVTINSSVSGDATSGGLVAVYVGGGQLTITDCLFDGAFTGSNCYANGGFVGWSEGKINIVNGHFAPSKIDTRYSGCHTWARMRNSDNLTVTNSHFTKSYDGTADDLYTIHSKANWTTFCDAVKSAKGEKDVNVVLNTDLSLTNEDIIGTDYPYRGTFDGNGHTINIDIDGYDYFGLFKNVTSSTTIRNVRVTGKVKGRFGFASLVGKCSEKCTDLNIDHVRVSTDLTSNIEQNGIMGGFVGVVEKGTKVNITDCLYDGNFVTTLDFKACFIASASQPNFYDWHQTRVYEHSTGDNGGIYSMNNYIGQSPHNGGWHSWSDNDVCLSSHDTKIGFDKVPEDCRNITKADTVLARMNASMPGQWEKDGSGNAVPIISMTGARLLAALGPCWQMTGGTVIPKTATVSVNPSALPDFYHEGTGRIDKVAHAETRQSSVVLTWTVDGGVVDYFRVYRRVEGTTEWGEPIADQIDKMGYEDTTVSPLLKYEYKVVAVADCEGLHTSETDVVKGSCKNTGRVSGYVRMNDGTSVAGIEVEIVPEGHEGNKTTVTTDDNGYFVADELSYYGGQSITYTVTPVSGDNIKLERGSMPVTFDAKSNDEQLPEFIVTSGHRFSGYVMYEGTSIPVKGARFRVDGHDVHNAAGDLVETAYDGSFSFRVLGGTRRIQAVMDGHTFTDGGYYKGSAGHNFTDDVAQIYFYDATKVRLAGRVVGGDDQGRLPLENNLSRNNLGDDLTMVFTLEGDNTSWLIYDTLNPTLSERTDSIMHAGGKHKTRYTVQRKRMEVKPDSETGEYELLLPPVRWKVQQVYCKGYATLFQDGQVSEVVDLTDCLAERDSIFEGYFTDVDGQPISSPHETANARYNRIYHTPVEITYRQLGYDSFDYLGDRTYYATALDGTKAEVPLVYQDAAKTLHYTFDYPVFSVARKYPIEISVGERYLYNNDTRTGREDRVSVGGGTVTVHNGMKNGLDQETVELNAEGQGIFYLMAEATPRLLTGDDALRTVTMTLTQDGTTYEAEPLRGYVLNLFATGEGKDVLASGTPLLIDILRDPPGSGSSATLSKGSTLKLSYEVEMQFKGGLTLEFGYGTALDTYNGVVAAGKENGTINGTDLTNLFSLDVIFSGAGKKAYSYTMNVDEDITTSSAPNMVGADADLYIGVVQNTVVTPMSTIRAIPDAMYQQMLGSKGGSIKGGTSQGDSITVKSKYGSMVEIAQGTGADGSLYHLVRDVSLGYGPQVTSQFIHSQKYITTELLPKLVQEIRDLLFTGTRDEAVALANTTGKAVYWSKVAADHKDFGTTGAYEMIKPTGKTGLKDEVLEKYNNMVLWIEMIMVNEREKLWAYDKVANYDVDGGAAVTHSESFESEYSQSQYISYPFTTADYFENDGQSWKDRLNAAAGALLSQPGLVSAANALTKLINDKANATRKDDNNNVQRVHISFFGNDFQFGLKPVAEYSSIGTYGSQNNYSRKESFNIVMGSKSHLSVDVFRVLTEATDTTKVKDVSWLDVYHNVNFDEWAEIVKNHVKDGVSYEGIDYSKAIYPRSFVYRTRGGATANPWENARYTIAYQPGTLLDERTKKIENPKITADRQSVSGVPYGETARFTIYLTNDSEYPEAAGRSLTTYTLYADDSSNPYGAKITCDGKPLDTDGRKIILSPGEVVTKVIEVSGGNAFDLEGLTIGIASEEDWRQIYDELSLDVHYLHQAGPVNISLPGDKWVMNTNAQYDKDRGWFMPVIIDGFDRHQHNFDHIELQYKESLRGDDAWTNLCSYYADEALMKAASGEREMIPENGNIEAHFYGEGTVMEKAYDLRAVLYCRNGNSFLTTASPIVSGVKDTRRPQLFGTPEPKDGLLGIGDNIIFNFTEDIEYNYLNAITNFEVKGEVNKDNVSEAVSLQFTGNGSVESEAQRNFSGKDLTIDLMIRPDETGRDMPLFSHGTNGKKLQLWLTSDRKLKAIIDDQTFVSTDTIVKGGFTQVALSISQADSILTFYNGGKTIGQAKLTEPYNGTGRLIFGRTNETDRSQSTYYSGRMMEARLWYRAMTGGQVGTTYGSQRLTGYEMGLVDYYPMNEGTGDYAVDHTQGANAQLMGASWAMPRGWSLRLENEGVALTQQALARTAEQDYTMMFWFKTDDADGTLVSNGEGVANEAGAQNRFWLGFDGGTLTFRSNGMTVEAGSGYNDNQWHHYAMTVNRARGVANIYVDQALKATFAPDSIGGISGGTPVIGGCVVGMTDGTVNAPARAPLATPMAATGNTVDLSTLTTDYEAKDGDVLTGKLSKNVKISIADGAIVTLNGATINGNNYPVYSWAGITCLGNATIILNGVNSIRGFYDNYPGIYIAKDKTLTIQGDGSLNAIGRKDGAGIGGGYNIACGNIIIEGGTISATGDRWAAGIGGGYNIACGNITITGGIVNAKGGKQSAGIGGSMYGTCGNITITNDVTSVTAIKGEDSPNSIGAGYYGECGTVTIGGSVGAISESPYTYAPYHSVTGVSLNKTNTTLPVGSSETLTATVTPANATNKDVTWKTSDTSVATVTNGTVTAVAPGTATITVTTTEDSKTATCTVTVTQPTTGVTLNKVNTTIPIGSTETLTATVYPPNATDKSVTWTTSNAAVATVADGIVTAVAVGTATITVTSSNGSTATCEVTVTQPVTGVSLNKTSTTLYMGSTETLKATVAPADATDKSVTWMTSNAEVATVTNGLVIAVAPGTATITVTTVDGAKTATCTVTVIMSGLVSDLTGNLDELCMFAQALPLTLIKAYATKSPQGDEAGLLTYLSFDRQERQKDNSIETVAYPWSKKIYLDDMGEVRYELDPVTKQATSTPVRDYVFVAAQDEVLRHITSETAAPVVPYEELTNLKFSFAGKDNQVLVGIDELTQRINHRNIYVTLRDVEDKNGNAMASPQTACYYVNSSSMQWVANRVTRTVAYGTGEGIYLGVENKSATSRTFTIENCPKWLTLDTYSDVVPAQDMVLVTAMVNPSLNVGSYDEIIYLTDEDGVKEPLYLSLTVEGEQPEWAEGISGDLLQHSMNIAGRVLVNDEIDIDSRDIVGAFGRDGQCHGYANISYSALTGESNLYLTVYDNQASGRDLYFKLWQYSTGRELVLTPPAPITFQNGTVLGTDEPVLFKAGTEYVQTFDLAAGWNWVSFNVASEKLFNLGTLLDGLPWKEGDVLTDMNSDATLIYRSGHWLVSGGASVTSLSQKNAYAIMVHEPVKFPIAGNVIKQLDMRTIELKQGWNGIGYTPMLNLPIETALSDYYDKAQPGDVIKSHDQFAYFTVTGGVGRWKGSLEYMKPGEGYMLLRKAESATSFVYPFYEPGSTFIDEWSYSTARAAAPARAKATMSVSAVVEGVEMQEGDRLVAFADGEMVGTAAFVSGKTADHTEPLYLSIEGDKQQGIWFAIERDGEIVAATSEQMTFTANAVIGSPDEPTKISFVQTDREDGKWYTVSGIQLLKQPTRSGVYIFNGKKVVIK